MADWSKPGKTIALALLALSAAIFVPVFPNEPVSGDPAALSDPRIDAHIAPADLVQILQLVRGGRFSSAYQHHFVQTRLPLRSLSTAKPSLLVGSGPVLTVAPRGEIQATFATDCRPNCPDGMTYYFTRRGNIWHITKIEWWVS